MTDRQVGERARALRLRAEITQDEVAERMRARGWEKWSQSTVWSVEKGERPLRLLEAQALASALDSSVATLLQTPDYEIVEADQRLVRDITRLAAAIQFVRLAQIDLAKAVAARPEDSEGDLPAGVEERAAMTVVDLLNAALREIDAAQTRVSNVDVRVTFTDADDSHGEEGRDG